MIRTLVVDDSPVFLLSILRFLNATPHLDVVGDARSGHEAIEQVERLQPDLVVLDLEMPQMNGLAVARLLKSRPEAPFIIMLTMHDDHAYRAQAIEANADGFVSKSEADIELLSVIDRLFDR